MDPLQQGAEGRKRYPFLILVFALLTASLIAGAWYYFPPKKATEPDLIYTITEQLRLSSEHYRRAESLYEVKEYLKAAEEFEKAKADAISNKQSGQIEIRKARAIAGAGNYEEAIKLLKRIAADPQYTAQAKAYAIEWMGRLFFSTHDPKITMLIFSDEPYRSMIKENDFELAYRRLFEYSSSFYPTAAAELRIAVWYANQIRKMHIAKTMEENKAKIDEYKEIIREKIKSADYNMANPGRREDVDTQRSLVLSRKATLIGTMILTGDTSFGDAESLFQQSLALADTENQEVFTLYHYAAFLANLGKPRHVEAATLIKRTYADDRYKDERFMKFLTNEHNNVIPLVYNDIRLLASIDPGFKSFLVTLGWKF